MSVIKCLSLAWDTGAFWLVGGRGRAVLLVFPGVVTDTGRGRRFVKCFVTTGNPSVVAVGTHCGLGADFLLCTISGHHRTPDRHR